MKSSHHPVRGRQFIDDLAAAGRYSFTSAEARATLGVSNATAKVALSRLAKKGLVASPARGFYVIVPPEYRSLGGLPPEQFVPALMEKLKLPYYVGLLTAAQYHGAAHQRPQEFQVFLERARLPIRLGKVRVRFLVRKRLKDVPALNLNTQRGTIRVSTPEATALDLVGYARRAGSLGQITAVLSELAEHLDSKMLAIAAATAPVAWAQRLGHLLERAGAAAKTEPLKAYVHEHAHEAVMLLPRARASKRTRDNVWKLFLNVKVEPDL